MNTEIKELENKITTWKNLSMFQDFSKEIAEAEAKILELKQQKDINIVISSQEKEEDTIKKSSQKMKLPSQDKKETESIMTEADTASAETCSECVCGEKGEEEETNECGCGCCNVE